MPTGPWKKTIIADDILSSLRSKGSGSLVVKTGFPTSLADLIVKNHGRLKKASRKNKKNPPRTSDRSAAEGRGAATRSSVLGFHSSDPVIDRPVSADGSTVAAPRFWLLVGSLILLVALVIGKKKLVLLITVSAFSLLLLEIYGLRGRGILNPCLEARKMLDSAFDSFGIRGREWASPIREVSVGFRVDLSVLGGKHDESRIPDQCSESLVGSRFAEVCRKSKLETFANCKAMKLLRKFRLSKSHRARDGRIPHFEATKEGLSEKDLLEKEDEDGDYEVQSFKTCYDDLGDGEETYSLHSNVDGSKLSRRSQFVFCLIVLCGLVRGKTVALLLALAWCFFFKFIKVMRDKGKMT